MAETEFQRHWAAEIIRQREVHWGPMADNRALRIARRQQQPADQIAARAAVLLKEQGFTSLMQRYATLLRLGQLLLAMIAIIAGLTLANNIVHTNDRVISLLDALVALLAINTLLIVVWALSTLLRARPGGLGGFVMHQVHALIKNDKLAAVAQAHASLSLRQGLLKPASGVITHGFWALLVLSALLTLILRFSVEDYQFVWRTTLLDESTVRSIINGLSTLPALLGQPSPAVHLNMSPDGHNLHQQTAHWLLSCIAIYALAPRVVLLAVCAIWLRLRLRAMSWDFSLPGFAEVQRRFMRHEYAVVDPAPEHTQPSIHQTVPNKSVGRGTGKPLLFALEHSLGNPELPAAIESIDMVASRGQRHALLTQLEQQPVPRLVVAIDTRLTPDRGSLRFLQEVADTAPLGVLLQHSDQNPQRSDLWRDLVTPALTPHIWTSVEAAVNWLQQNESAHE